MTPPRAAAIPRYMLAEEAKPFTRSLTRKALPRGTVVVTYDEHASAETLAYDQGYRAGLSVRKDATDHAQALADAKVEVWKQIARKLYDEPWPNAIDLRVWVEQQAHDAESLTKQGENDGKSASRD